MKHTLTILLAFATAAHAQFAVMHTNGVVTSPTNFTIQQSNVAGLQSSLDSKLATNGSAAGLTGFVGATNAETARGNLGISNTFAGQFHADFYDDFSRYTNGTQFTNNRAPLFGSNYVLRVLGTNGWFPRIVSGALTDTNNGVWYLSTELPRPVYNFGGVVTWEDKAEYAGSAAVFIVRPNEPVTPNTTGRPALTNDSVWLDKFLHIVITPLAAAVDVAMTNGASGLTNIFTQSFATTPLQRGVPQTISAEIDNSTLRLRVGGKRIEVTDSRISQVNGRFFSFESFLPEANTNFAGTRWSRVWANSPNMMQYAAQPLSEALFNFANGDANANRYLTVGTNLADYYGNYLAPSAPAFIDGTVRVKGGLLGWTGTDFKAAPLVDSRGTGASGFFSSGNNNTTNLSYMWAEFLNLGKLTNNWSRWNVTAIGTLANNTNQKRVTFETAEGTQFDTGSITNSGEWILKSYIYRTPTNTHEVLAVFEMDNFRKSSRFTLNLEATWGFAIRGAGTSNNEVILRGAWADWYP
jgi:hypothetical protein